MADDRPTQAEKAERFHALHMGDEPFILANAFDAGSARILAGLGFEALATTSGGFAGTLGRRDGEITRDEALDNARAVVDAVDLPVSADLENGFGHEPEALAKTVTQAAEAGLDGCTIEDFTGDTDRPFYDRELAAERIVAAAEAARSVGFRFTLTARSECFIRGLP
ncbi:MAG: isocitrate lyase/phosphoenolpyruvate mutase family protein, partial [Rhodospirillaceae bacterium]|nr:isocitrate lyase/phosphoenolpyruvate mutase family protein [Rhodospirillaceae bacterium]